MSKFLLLGATLGLLAVLAAPATALSASPTGGTAATPTVTKIGSVVLEPSAPAEQSYYSLAAGLDGVMYAFSQNRLQAINTTTQTTMYSVFPAGRLGYEMIEPSSVQAFGEYIFVCVQYKNQIVVLEASSGDTLYNLTSGSSEVDNACQQGLFLYEKTLYWYAGNALHAAYLGNGNQYIAWNANGDQQVKGPITKVGAATFTFTFGNLLVEYNASSKNDNFQMPIAPGSDFVALDDKYIYTRTVLFQPPTQISTVSVYHKSNQSFYFSLNLTAFSTEYFTTLSSSDKPVHTDTHISFVVFNDANTYGNPHFGGFSIVSVDLRTTEATIKMATGHTYGIRAQFPASQEFVFWSDTDFATISYSGRIVVNQTLSGSSSFPKEKMPVVTMTDHRGTSNKQLLATTTFAGVEVRSVSTGKAAMNPVSGFTVKALADRNIFVVFANRTRADIYSYSL